MIPEISVVIPVKNEASKIRACIDGILTQTIRVKEIIAIDSGSTDATINILKTYPQVKLVQIPSAEFNHGETRNLGVQNASGEFLVLTVGDARPYNEYWLEELLKGFTDDDVAGVCGQQVVPHEKDKNPADWFRPVSEPVIKRYQFDSAESFELLAPEEKKKLCSWDDVTAMYRRSVLIQLPFQRVSYCEDAIWARDVLKKGKAIVYNYKARVYHYHNEDAGFTFKRSFTTMYFRFKQFGLVPKCSPVSFIAKLRIIKSLIKGLGANVPGIIKWYRYNMANTEAALKACTIFMNSLKTGENALDAKHAELCGTPPIPLKTT